jgi:hypothetical protein
MNASGKIFTTESTGALRACLEERHTCPGRKCQGVHVAKNAEILSLFSLCVPVDHCGEGFLKIPNGFYHQESL